MQSRPSADFRSVADTRLGDHVCLPVESDDQRLAQTAAFVEHAFRQGGKALVLTCAESPGEMVAELDGRIPGVGAALAVGQLGVLATEDVNLAGGNFDPQRITERYRAEHGIVVQQGYRGLWAAVDMTWALSGAPGIEALPEFEAAANTLFLNAQAAVVCVYDLRKFAMPLMERFCSAHPVTLGQAVLRCTGTGEAEGLMISGEADYTNRAALAALLRAVRSADGHVTIDASELRFVDVHAARLLVELERARTHGTTSITASRRVHRVMQLARSIERGDRGRCDA